MKRENVQDLLAMMQSAYPNYNPIDKKLTINVWTIALEDYGENEVIAAFKSYLKSDASGFAPSPGQLIEEIYQTEYQDELNENEAWDLVINAIYNEQQGNTISGYLGLPDVIKSAVGGAESFSRMKWMDEKERSKEKYAFIRCYKEELQKSKKRIKLSAKELPGGQNQQIEQKNEENIYKLDEPRGVQA